MSIRYSVIEIFTSEGARCRNRVLYEEVLAYVRGLKIAARCTVTKGTEACYEDGEMATQNIVDLSYNMPLKIEIILPSAELDPVMEVLEQMVCEGIVGVRELNVYWHKARKRLLPPQIKVRDVMTALPKRVQTTTPVDQVVRLLLSQTFTGVPVVDAQDRPVGVISQTDLIYRAKMPMRLALMASSEPETVDGVLKSLAEMTAEAIMTQPDVHIQEDALLTDGVNLMLEKNVKRPPGRGCLGKAHRDRFAYGRFPDHYPGIARLEGCSERRNHVGGRPLRVRHHAAGHPHGPARRLGGGGPPHDLGRRNSAGGWWWMSRGACWA